MSNADNHLEEIVDPTVVIGHRNFFETIYQFDGKWTDAPCVAQLLHPAMERQLKLAAAWLCLSESGARLPSSLFPWSILAKLVFNGEASRLFGTLLVLDDNIYKSKLYPRNGALWC